MKLAAELLLGTAACAAAYYVARPAETRPKPAQHGEPMPAPSTNVAQPTSTETRQTAARVVVARSPTPSSSAEQDRAMATLRNEVIVAASADMQRRGEDLARCFAEADLVGEQKLRFAVDVESMPRAATVRAWRFVEIVDGEPLPETFAACAARALGRDHTVLPPPGVEFPSYRGEVSILYRLPAAPVSE